MVAVPTPMHPRASVTVTAYGPEGRLVAILSVLPPDQSNNNGGTAPVTVGVAVPPRVVPQNTGVDCTATCGAGIPGMVALSITVSFLLSVRVRV